MRAQDVDITVARILFYNFFYIKAVKYFSEDYKQVIYVSIDVVKQFIMREIHLFNISLAIT